ncbi:Hri1p [Saccharomyces eubayanus]|uniref:Hri1p n=1 Tax=Saccharomyces eubayanus TaxID=1080349 RepID=UPI0006C362C7|nr:HRI1-like protein [Saccharomyces eubayanus]KOG97983.1 HRI1-like protein [Saccharomyces eubayanus]
MPALFKRLLFQVGPQPGERTFTLSSVSNDGHYISLRPFVKPKGDSESAFPFEWAFAGTNETVKVKNLGDGVVTQDFNFWLDTNVYLNVPNTHRGEINTTWKDWDSGCVEETGSVYPFGADKESVSFRELWQPVDPSREDLVIVSPNNETFSSNAKSIVLKVNDEGYDGLVIIVGRWVQGFLSKKNQSTIDGLNFIRLLENDSGKFESLLSYGEEAKKIPQSYENLKKGSTITSNGLNWEVIEYHV